ncbi:DUF2333 family protein [Rhodovulum sp. DZ06]|uniref:DUF2333 family protein n=1 Tax=Rhodovulum sp. DZ06 TaxID=3425126 RepID=UPI003D33684F
MTRIIDFFLDIWDRLMAFLGLDRIYRRGREKAFEGRSPFGRLLGWGRPLLALLALAWVVYAIWTFSITRSFDLQFPQKAMIAAATAPVQTGEQTEAGAGTESKTCTRSSIVDIQGALIDQVVNQDEWVAANPVYKFGLFGILPWEATPFFDNKMSFQIGVLDMVKNTARELETSLGRVRGTSAADTDLQGALSRLQVNERSWVFNNPFDPQLNTLTVSAPNSYRGAIRLYEQFNTRLASCDALFDARADNLFNVLMIYTSSLGSISEQLSQRSRGEEWDVDTHAFVESEGAGNDRGWFDTRADNLFMQAKGRLYALHGLMQGARQDFAEVIETRNMADVWDRMEAHLAEGAALAPTVISNGRADGTVAPDHLSVMAAHVLRARANMVEVRSILDR